MMDIEADPMTRNPRPTRRAPLQWVPFNTYFS